MIITIGEHPYITAIVGRSDFALIHAKYLFHRQRCLHLYTLGPWGVLSRSGVLKPNAEPAT